MELEPFELSHDHVPAALRLSREAGWNQTTDDWNIFIRNGTVFGLKEADGTLVATSAILPYEQFGFVAMVLVTADRRGRGFATRLLETALAALCDDGLVAVLDATAAGAAVYRRLGFCPLFDLCRWERLMPVRGPAGPAVIPVTRLTDTADVDAFVRLDAAAFGSERRFLHEALLRRTETRAFMSDGDTFLVARRGQRATQLGPLVADTEIRAVRLLEASIAVLDGPIFLDVADHCSGIIRWLEAHGFRRQRPFHRMAFGRATAFGDPLRLMASAGPEFG